MPSADALRVLVIGRPHRSGTKPGGLTYLADLLCRRLDNEGARSHLLSWTCADIPDSTFDAALHVGDEKFIHIQAVCFHARNPRSPFCINAQFDGRRVRRKASIARLQKLQEITSGPVRLLRFSDRVEVSPGNDLFIPHPWRDLLPPEKTTFAGRSGICIGDLAKASNPRITGGFDLDSLRGIGEPIHAYRQYGITDERKRYPWIEVAPYMGGSDLARFLAARKLFLQVCAHETFGMVACEAASMGTPVLHVPMAHSLNHALPSATRAREEILSAAQEVTSNEAAWMDLANSCAVDAEAYRGISLRGSIERGIRG